MILISLFLLTINQTNNKINEKECFKIFDQKQFSKLINTCSKIDNPSTRLRLIIVTAEFFQKIPYRRINEIFHYGNGGKDAYELVFKKDLLTKYEENTINEYFGQFKQFADLGEPIAQVLTAKLFYIIEYILKQDKDSNFDFVKFTQIKKELYTKNLDKYIQVFPDDPEALYLLGIEGLKNVYGGNINKVFFKITNPRYYEYLIKANKLKYPNAKRYVDGVEAYKTHLNRTEKKAEQNDADALFELGLNLYRKEKGNKENISRAIVYLTKAAKQNHIQSLKWLTKIYSKDSPNLSKYIQTQKALIELNDSDAMLELGDYYLCKKETDKAEQLYEKAKTLNNPIAQFALDDLKYEGEPSQGCQ